jgi:Asp-tRNA(Asn)/Glu-tRNA(Gln) amidotransferase A subunit family amidase
MMAQTTKAPRTTAPASTHPLATENKTAFSKVRHAGSVLLGKLTVAQMANKSPAFYQFRRFITVFTTARHGIYS